MATKNKKDVRQTQPQQEQQQLDIFGELKIIDSWQEEWNGMPEFVQDDLQPFASIIVHFENREDMEAFAKLVDQNITYQTKSIYYPKASWDIVKGLRYSDES